MQYKEMQLVMAPETIDFLEKIELPDLLENCGLEGQVFENLADLLGLLYDWRVLGYPNRIVLSLPSD